MMSLSSASKQESLIVLSMLLSSGSLARTGTRRFGAAAAAVAAKKSTHIESRALVDQCKGPSGRVRCVTTGALSPARCAAGLSIGAAANLV